MQIDISKAFDSFHWSFLLNTLTAIGLPEKFINWISFCITSASFSVQVNGELAGYFQSKRVKTGLLFVSILISHLYECAVKDD